MRNLNRKLLILCLAIFATVIFVAPSQAQYRRNTARNRTAYTKADVERVLRSVEERSDRFVGTFDRALDNSRLDGTNREDRLVERAKDLEEALDSLRSNFDRTDRFQNTRAQVSRVMSVANGINNVVRRRRLNRDAETQWSALRTELNSLARFYNVPQLR